ncbi:MAG: rod shape-determining protein MreD [Candidatus Cloacimonetes bacterium]|nr:rod shape-determining protein MreD [Candidatus Cloacimonadota bacterium]MCF7814255.1 rod shape-determining protein MreD [Candidatus Cloacimonadota bacterium]MCF7868462.1 rod shape-determining protein MreD [Candidatus Cloacimonadota bacterium]MCF7883918.1 rod shape-determining protein MreD [Candidatus Cloacimonadota bacterium]
MKIVNLIILGIFVLYFQIIFASNFVFWGIIPNFIIAFIIYLCVNSGIRSALTISFFWGLALDLMQPLYLGMNALIFIILAMIISNFHESVNKRRFIVVSFSVFLINLFYYLIFIFYNLIAIQSRHGFFSDFLLSVVYNSIISILLIYIFELLSKLKLVIDV